MLVADAPAAATLPDPSIPPPVALCACGCGQPAAIARRNYGPRRHVKGQPCRFALGHGRWTAALRQTPVPLPRPPAGSREAALIADIGARFGLAPGAIYERSRVEPIPQARFTAMWALAQIGHSPAAISRLLGLNHSTVLHGIARVWSYPAWQELARPALNLVGAGGKRLALAAWLNTSLPADLDVAGRRAVHAYAACALLGWEQHPPHVCSSGLFLVLSQPRIRAAVEDALHRVEQEAHIERIAWHAARVASAG